MTTPFKKKPRTALPYAARPGGGEPSENYDVFSDFYSSGVGTSCSYTFIMKRRLNRCALLIVDTFAIPYDNQGRTRTGRPRGGSMTDISHENRSLQESMTGIESPGIPLLR